MTSAHRPAPPTGGPLAMILPLSPEPLRRRAATALALCLALALAACDRPDEPPQAAVKSPPDPLVVQVSAQMAGRFQVAPLATAEVASVQEITGRIEPDERRVSRIGSGVTGRVTDVLVELGDVVHAGQPLARVASPELTEAQLAVLRANAAGSLADRAVDRAKQLFQADVIGAAELQRRESELSIARAELRAATDRLRLLGMADAEVARLREKGTLATATLVAAPRAGVVIERNVSQGQVAQPGDPLFTVADLDRVWVVGALPEQAAGTVEIGQPVEIVVPAAGAAPLAGRIVRIGATVQPDTRTVAIRTQVDNPKHALKPQMLATMRISGAPRRVLALPAAAVVRENDRDHVFVRTGSNRFRLSPVELGPASGGMRPLLQGAQEGAEIVVDGAFHLNNERKRAELE